MEPCVLMDPHTRIIGVRRENLLKFIVYRAFGDADLLITRCDIALIRQHPNLQKLHRLIGITIHFAVNNPRTRRHDLNLATSNHTTVPHAVAMRQIAFQRNADDFHIAVRMLAKATTAHNAVVIDHAQRAKTHAIGVVVMTKTKSVVAFEPAMIGITSAARRMKYSVHKSS